jgi:hypothetical protein
MLAPIRLGTLNDVCVMKSIHKTPANAAGNVHSHARLSD